jgi:uncharacterized phiE125 gp8 family phage protein
MTTMTKFPRRAGTPVAEPITLADALTHLRETADGGANDAYITSLITVARMACEDRTERTLITTPLVLLLDGFPTAIELARPPVIAVSALRYLDTAGVWQTVSNADYLVDAASEPGWLVPGPDKAWPTPMYRVNSVSVEYTAGYGATPADVPAPLKHWILLAISEMYENRSASAERPAVRNEFADYLLAPYRILGV